MSLPRATEVYQASLPETGKYRPWLERDIDERRDEVCIFIMLNPSTAEAGITADHSDDDPTIRRCKGFANRLNCGKLIVVNLFTKRATKPIDLVRDRDIVGEDGHKALECARIWYDDCGGFIIAAWGALPNGAGQLFAHKRRNRINDVHDAFLGCKIHALGTTKDGSPRHPLYIKNAAALVDYTFEMEAQCL